MLNTHLGVFICPWISMFIRNDLIKKYRYNHIYMFSIQMINLQLASCSFIVLLSDNVAETTNVGYFSHFCENHLVPLFT